MASKQAIYEMKQLDVLEAYNKVVGGELDKEPCGYDPAAFAALEARVADLEKALADNETSEQQNDGEESNAVQ